MGGWIRNWKYSEGFPIFNILFRKFAILPLCPFSVMPLIKDSSGWIMGYSVPLFAPLGWAELAGGVLCMCVRTNVGVEKQNYAVICAWKVVVSHKEFFFSWKINIRSVSRILKNCISRSHQAPRCGLLMMSFKALFRFCYLTFCPKWCHHPSFVRKSHRTYRVTKSMIRLFEILMHLSPPEI